MTIDWLLDRLNDATAEFVRIGGIDVHLTAFRPSGDAHDALLRSGHLKRVGADMRFAGLIVLFDFQSPQDQTITVYGRSLSLDTLYQVAFRYQPEMAA